MRRRFRPDRAVPGDGHLLPAAGRDGAVGRVRAHVRRALLHRQPQRAEIVPAEHEARIMCIAVVLFRHAGAGQSRHVHPRHDCHLPRRQLIEGVVGARIQIAVLRATALEQQRRLSGAPGRQIVRRAGEHGRRAVHEVLNRRAGAGIHHEQARKVGGQRVDGIDDGRGGLGRGRRVYLDADAAGVGARRHQHRIGPLRQQLHRQIERRIRRRHAGCNAAIRSQERHRDRAERVIRQLHGDVFHRRERKALLAALTGEQRTERGRRAVGRDTVDAIAAGHRQLGVQLRQFGGAQRPAAIDRDIRDLPVQRARHRVEA